MATRLAFAAVLAVIVHAVLLAVKVPWVTPRMMAPRSRDVTINLISVTTLKPVPDVRPAAPIPKPPPKAIRRPNPKPKAKPTANVRKPKPPPTPVPAPVKQTAAPSRVVDPPPVQDGHPPSGEFEDAAPSPTPTIETGAIVDVSVPLYDINPPPNYPDVAIRRRYEGTVLLDVLVDKTGLVAQVKVARSSGYAILDRNAKADVSRWRFKPAHRGTQTIEMWVKVPVRYKLRK